MCKGISRSVIEVIQIFAGTSPVSKRAAYNRLSKSKRFVRLGTGVSVGEFLDVLILNKWLLKRGTGYVLSAGARKSLGTFIPPSYSARKTVRKRTTGPKRQSSRVVSKSSTKTSSS